MNHSRVTNSDVGPATVRVPGRKTIPSVLVSAAFALLLMGGLSSCITGLTDTSSRGVQCRPIEVLAESSLPQYANGTLGIFLPSVTSKGEVDTAEVFRAYYEELSRVNAFRAVKVIPQTIRTAEEAQWWGRREGCDLTMKLTVRQMLDGSGNLPTRMEMSVDILDVRSGTLAWSVRQGAHSDPGKDVDLYWTTMSGEPAQRARVLSRALAMQLSKFMIDRELK